MTHDPLPALLSRAAQRLADEFASLPPHESACLTPQQESAISRVLDETAHRLGDNYPYFHPLYAGQMLKPPHPVARAAYALAMAINPNNHARDGGRASSAMEIEAVAAIASMFGWEAPDYLAHLTSSGTIANLEALWVAGQIAPGKRILASEQAHYTHARISAVLQLQYANVETDNFGRMSIDALQAELRKGDAGTVVVTLGTTAIGAVDPLDQVLDLQREYGFRIHVDAAYGGYFKLIPDSLDEPARRAFALIHHADSIVVDPHKHGLQPYGCGCVLFRDPGVGRFYKHDSPYTYFTSRELHLGEISLECSRAGAAAVALWATQRLLPPVPGGEFARGLASGRAAARDLNRRLRADPRFETLTAGFSEPAAGFSEPAAGLSEPAAGHPELDIVAWKIALSPRQRASRRAQEIFDNCAARNLHLALVQLPYRWFGSADALVPEAGKVTCLRSVLMKPEHEAWLDRIWSVFSDACNV